MKTKTITVIFLTAAIVFSMSAAIFAQAINISNEITYTRKFFSDNAIQSTSFEQNMAYLATGVNYYMEFEPYFSGDQSVQGLAKDILTAAATGKAEEAETTAKIASLTGKQSDDGAFGTVEDTAWAIIALKTVSAAYDSEKAVHYLVDKKNDDGSISDSADDLSAKVLDTSIVLTAFSLYIADQSVYDAATDAVNFIYNSHNDSRTFGDGTAETLAKVMTALVDVSQSVNDDIWNIPSLLLSFKNDDYSYKNTADGEPSVLTTATALIALDAAGNGDSIYKRLMEDGTLKRFDIKDYLSTIIIYAVLALFSLVFWGYIMFFRKKNTRTLEQAKREKEERLDM